MLLKLLCRIHCCVLRVTFMGMPQQCVGGRFQDVGRCHHVEKFDYMNGELTLTSCLASSQRTFGLNVFP
jgi:hypothetical protein